MPSPRPVRRLPWLEPGDAFPPAQHAWSDDDPAPGLLAAGGTLDVATLLRAYSSGIFPWFSDDQPLLWWSTDPRMTLRPREFRLHRSLRKTVRRFAQDARCEIRVDHDFATVIRACSMSPRDGQRGTWIVPAMVDAYVQLHLAGFAHSVETWIGGRLVGGLYCVTIGRAVFGESMFARETDASKIALAALVAMCRTQGVELIDCQQNTAHLASLGAREMPRTDFIGHVASAIAEPQITWRFDVLYWNAFLQSSQPPV